MIFLTMDSQAEVSTHAEQKPQQHTQLLEMALTSTISSAGVFRQAVRNPRVTVPPDRYCIGSELETTHVSRFRPLYTHPKK